MSQVDDSLVAELHNGIVSFAVTLYFTLVKTKTREEALDEVRSFLTSLADEIVNQTNIKENT